MIHGSILYTVFINYSLAGLVSSPRTVKLALATVEGFSVKLTCPHEEKTFKAKHLLGCICWRVMTFEFDAHAAK